MRIVPPLPTFSRRHWGWCLLLLSWMVLAEYASFLAALAQRESSGVATTVNKYGYAGLYQMGEAALIDAGYYRHDGSKGNDWRGSWTGKDGINSLSDFLHNAQAQTNAITTYHSLLWRQIERRGLDDLIGQTIDGRQVTASGLIAGAHLLGVGGLTNCLRHGGGCKDGFGTAASSYISRFSGYDISDLIGGTALPPATPPTGGTTPIPVNTTPLGTNWTPISLADAFYAGSGVDFDQIKEAIAGILAIALLLWTAWISLAQYSSWRNGAISLFEGQNLIIKATILTLLVLVIVLY